MTAAIAAIRTATARCHKSLQQDGEELGLPVLRTFDFIKTG
jgi:hypothetical protein